MTSSITLTADEKKIFDSLPDKVRGDWTVKLEKRSFKDSKEDRCVRRSLVKFKSSQLQKFQDDLAKAESLVDVEHLAQKLESRDLPEEDIAEMFFLIGPEVIGRIIENLLKNAKAVSDLQSIEQLTQVREMVLGAFLLKA